MSLKNNISNADDEQSDETPHFQTSGNNNPFRTERDYFSDLELKISDQISEFEERKLIAPELCSINKYNPFDVPKNYFDDLTTLVQQNIADKRSKKSFIEELLLLIRPRFVVPVFATLLVAFLGINYITNYAKQGSNQSVTETTFEEQLSTIDEATIIETLASENITEAETGTEENQKIENYLIENNIDENNLSTDL